MLPAGSARGWSMSWAAKASSWAAGRNQGMERNWVLNHCWVLPLGQYMGYIYIYTGWWFGTWLLFSIYWEFHHPNWRTHIFQPGRSTTNQPIIGCFSSEKITTFQFVVPRCPTVSYTFIDFHGDSTHKRQPQVMVELFHSGLATVRTNIHMVIRASGGVCLGLVTKPRSD